MYIFKRGGVQGLFRPADEPWNYSATGSAVSFDQFDEISPQIESTTAVTENAELDLETDSVTFPNGESIAWGVPMAVNHLEKNYHYQVQGACVIRGGDGKAVGAVPFVSYHTAALVANNTIVTNAVNNFKVLPHFAYANDGCISASCETSVILQFDEDDFETGNLIFGWMVSNSTGAASAVFTKANLSANKYVGDLTTFQGNM